MSEDQILDQPNEGGHDGEQYVQRKMAGNGKRFANFIIDTIVFYILSIVIGVFAGVFDPEILESETPASELILNLVFTLLFIIYSWAMESATGKTVGKYITRTKIVKPDGTRPTSINILGRSLCRLIPFDAFTYLSGNPGWHDSIPKIYVIEED